jgi:branched-chain amino acid transport system permease protein
MPGRFHLGSEVSSAWWRFLSTFGLTPKRFHTLPGWQQRLGKLAVGGVIAFLIAIFVNVLEASFGATGSTSIFTFDSTAYLAFLVLGLIYVPEWSKVPLIGKIAIPLSALALAITFPYWAGHMFTIPIFGEFPSTETGVVMLVFVMMAVGLNIVVGYAGLLDLGYVAFYAMGAYTAAWLASTQFAGAKCPKPGFGIDNCPVATVPAVDFNLGGVGITPGIGGIHVSIWLILAAAGLLTALIGVVIGLPTLRLRGDYLAIVTLGFGEILPQIARNGNDLGGFNLTGGPQGITPVDSPGFGNNLSNWTGGFLPANYLTSPNSARVFYWTALALVGFTVFCSIRLRDSRLGRAWIAIREDEVAASAMGIPLMRTKTWAYACGAFFGGIAGAYFAAFKSSTFPQDFYFNISVFILCMVILGGMGNVWGVMLGAAFLTYLNQEGLANTGAWLNLHFGTHVDVPEYSGGIYGVIIVLVMLLRPQGLLPSARRKRELELGTHDEYLYDVETHDESLYVEPSEA